MRKIVRPDLGRRAESVPTVTVRNGRALVQLNRPARHNCVGPQDIEAFQRILSRIEKDRMIRVLTLTGAGRSFCAGFDLRSLSAGNPRATRQKQLDGAYAFTQLVNRLEALRIPTICGLNGPVYGGGSDLALACDFRLGVRRTTMVIPVSRLGVHYYHGGLRRLVTRLGLGVSKRLLLLGQPIDAEEMLRIGFLDEVVTTPERLVQRIDALADLIAGAPVPTILSGMKRDLNRIAKGDMDSTATDSAWAQSVLSPAVAIAAAEQIAARRRRKKPRRALAVV
jgi:enoyl-CoA hydratase/carnithine racemase